MLEGKVLMSNFGLGLGYLLLQLLGWLIIIGWIVLTIICLLKLRKLELPATAKAIWAVFITVIPVLGAVAFLIVKPGE